MITCPSCTKIVSTHEHEVVTRVLGGWLNIDQVDQLDSFVKSEYGDHCLAQNLCRVCVVDTAAQLV